jgi:hypothetical protein
MKKVEFLLSIRSNELKEMKEINLKHLEKLYLINYCKLNKCKILFCEKPINELKGMYEAKIKLAKLHQEKH